MRPASPTRGTGRLSATRGPVWSGEAGALGSRNYSDSFLRNQINGSLKCFSVSDTDFLLSKSDVQVCDIKMLFHNLFRFIFTNQLFMQIHNICNGVLSVLETTDSDDFMHLSGRELLSSSGIGHSQI